MPITVLKLSADEGEMLHAFSTLRTVDEKIQEKVAPLMAIRDILALAVQFAVFKDDKQDAIKEIKLDDNHSIVFTLKDGKFDYDQTCNCPEHQEQAEGPNEDIEAQLRGAGFNLLGTLTGRFPSRG